MSGIAYIFITVILAVAGQLLLKKSMIEFGPINLTTGNLFPLIFDLFTKPLILFGLSLYGIGTIFWLAALSNVELSYAYPMISVSYVLIFLFSWIFFHEHISLTRILAMVIIVFGVYLISRT